MTTFLWPFFLLFVFIPLVVKGLRTGGRGANATQGALSVPFYHEVTQLGTGRGLNREQISKLARVLAWAAWICLVLAAARPQWTGAPVTVRHTGRDLLMALDLSASMTVKDFSRLGQTLTRLDAVKLVADDFIKKRENDRIGLILFGTHVYLQVPLTYDLANVQTVLTETEIGLAGKSTAIGDALALAVKTIKDHKQDSRVVILLTDGQSNAGALSPTEAIELAKAENVKVYTIGIGATEMQVRGLFGSVTRNPSRDLDEDTLKLIAGATGGEYYRATDIDSLEDIYSEIDRLEPADGKGRTVRPVRELYHFPLGAAIVFTALAVLVLLKPQIMAANKTSDSIGGRL